MIIQCEQCQTKFRLDDSKVKDTGAKVRCARCKHVFAVSKELPESVPTTDFGAILDQNVAVADESPFASLEAAHAAGTKPEYDFDSSSFVTDEQEQSSSSVVDSSLFDLPEEEKLPAGEAAPEFSLFAHDTDLEPELSGDDKPAPDSGKILQDFDFSDTTEHDEGSADESAQFSDFADESAAPLDFNVQLGDFADAGANPEGKEGASKAALSGDEHFAMEDIDFGDEITPLPSHEVNPADSKGGLDFDFSHLDEPHEPASLPESEPSALFLARLEQPYKEEAAAQPEPPKPAKPATEEQPPLPITSRRKPFLMMPVVLSAVAVIGMGIMIYMGNSRPPEEAAKPAPPAENITLSAVDASFIKNKKAGDLLVISGTVVNNFTTPRAAVQIKGLVYGDKDQVLTSKIAYCGNTLTNEQLTTMPLKTIEAAMANQFGSALDNLEVAPGKSIPCMVVISDLPEDAKNYGAELAGSSPVTPKQK